MKYHILKETIVYDGFLKIKQALITHDRFQKDNPVTCTREALDKAGFVAVLLFEKDTDQIILINQFRYPSIENGNGWLLEIPAGGVEKEEGIIEAGIREVEEETGYVLTDLEHIQTCFTSPGITSERMHLYYSEVTQGDKKSKGGGAPDEDEDIQICKYSVKEIHTLLNSEIVVDAKSIIALQWLMLNKL